MARFFSASLRATCRSSSTAPRARTAPGCSAPFSSPLSEFRATRWFRITCSADLRLAFGLPEPPDLATVKSIMTSKPETLAATLDKIDQTYGSFANYLRHAAKLSEADLAKIRLHLLEP